MNRGQALELLDDLVVEHGTAEDAAALRLIVVELEQPAVEQRAAAQSVDLLAQLDVEHAAYAALLARRDAALAIHRREVYGEDGACCAACIGPHEEPVPWPCDTARALGVTP